MKKIAPLLGCALLVALTGCVSAIKATADGKVAITVTEKVFGVIVAQSTQNQPPQIQLGFITSVVKLTPCSTNGPLWAAPTADTFSIGNNAVPFSFDVTETDATGNYQTGNANSTNTVTSQPIVPK